MAWTGSLTGDNAVQHIVDPAGIFRPPTRLNMFGSPAQYQSEMDDYSEGAQRGNAQLNQGVGLLGQAAQQGTATNGLALQGAQQAGGLFSSGGSLLNGAMASQDIALNPLVQDPGAGVRAQAAVQNQANNAAALALARTGGPAAMRQALNQNAQGNIAIGNAAQAAQAQQNINAAGVLGSLYGQRAQLGAGLQAQGLGAQQGMLGVANQSTGLLGNAGAGIGQLGAAQNQFYSGQGLQAAQAQLGADEATQKAQRGVLGGVATALGGLFG